MRWSKATWRHRVLDPSKSLQKIIDSESGPVNKGCNAAVQGPVCKCAPAGVFGGEVMREAHPRHGDLDRSPPKSCSSTTAKPTTKNASASVSSRVRKGTQMRAKPHGISG